MKSTKARQACTRKRARTVDAVNQQYLESNVISISGVPLEITPSLLSALESCQEQASTIQPKDDPSKVLEHLLNGAQDQDVQIEQDNEPPPAVRQFLTRLKDESAQVQCACCTFLIKAIKEETQPGALKLLHLLLKRSKACRQLVFCESTFLSDLVSLSNLNTLQQIVNMLHDLSHTFGHLYSTLKVALRYLEQNRSIRALTNDNTTHLGLTRQNISMGCQAAIQHGPATCTKIQLFLQKTERLMSEAFPRLVTDNKSYNTQSEYYHEDDDDDDNITVDWQEGDESDHEAAVERTLKAMGQISHLDIDIVSVAVSYDNHQCDMRTAMEGAETAFVSSLPIETNTTPKSHTSLVWCIDKLHQVHLPRLELWIACLLEICSESTTNQAL